MSMIEKNKNLFVITLDNGKQTYFNFTDECFYGVSGREVQYFNAEAMKILRTVRYENFLAGYFYERTLSYPRWLHIRDWSTNMVETIYSLYSNIYQPQELVQIAELCHEENIQLNKNNVKNLTATLHELEDENGNLPSYIDWYILRNKYFEKCYPHLAPMLLGLVKCANRNPKIQKIIIEDSEKIQFRYEHENWNFIEPDCDIGLKRLYNYVLRYITLCERLHRERTYKNFYLSICQMEREIELMADELCADYQNNAPLRYENNTFTVLVPTTAIEFKAEADYQDNCVFRLYYPKVKKYETHVVFIRRKSNIDTPYITCEVDNNGRIVQYLTRFNKCVQSEDAKAFKHEYQQYLKQNFFNGG